MPLRGRGPDGVGFTSACAGEEGGETNGVDSSATFVDRDSDVVGETSCPAPSSASNDITDTRPSDSTSSDCVEPGITAASPHVPRIRTPATAPIRSQRRRLLFGLCMNCKFALNFSTRPDAQRGSSTDPCGFQTNRTWRPQPALNRAMASRVKSDRTNRPEIAARSANRASQSSVPRQNVHFISAMASGLDAARRPARASTAASS